METFFQNIVSSIGITDVLDILIVALIIYKLLGFIKETRAEQLAKGILVLVLSTIIAKIAHLYTLHWILSGVLNVGLIAIVVIFQPELRRLLENLGRSKITSVFSSVDREDAENIIREITDALIDMSMSKTGALIIIEREISLNDIVETGTVIDASVTAQMIGNIFYEGAPLHDGALILRGNRLCAAGCVLPLTQNKNLPKELGTRHRAGIGISENSDAIVLMVSEETGVISEAIDGKLTRNLDKNRIEEILRNVYFEENKDSFSDRVSKILKGDKNEKR